MATRLPSAPPILPGLAYIRPLGSGGFADVFLYEQDMPRRDVAVKVLPSDVRDPDLRRMFNAEADVLAHLSAHPSIVTVYQAGISADGRPYIVMEYCPGSLSQRYRIERIPVPEVLTIGVKMASALQSAHRAGLVHRDVKPSNILVTTFGAPVLADFGISSSLSRETADEVLAMSIPWSAPEVIAEETAGTVASEVWSLGATVYSLLAGHSPFERRERGQNTKEQLRRRIARASYTDVSRADVPASLQVVLARAMSRDARQRYASAREFAEALRSVQTELGISPTQLEIATEAWSPASAPVDFSDSTLRGPARSRIDRDEQRKTRPGAGMAQLARDEDTGFSAPDRPRRTMPWVAAAVGGAALVGGAIVAALVLAGVL
ncbi:MULTISPECIES: serine/threonine-protein kinase [unclassified Microbacterium]|uniref:serine/threonine-protein kinase n=1 Tax=unclassified Microbacterium TaxID=2609290 RepID=UPI00214C2195|nr:MULTISPECIES: serine/threonine-protein kinase [unclassified Microbacterium]MCR2808811.1 serine/threonine protein kinase [Microbacterium sp. zg.B185]WIM18767.1 serine/threonine-protein kinase [Microbacterium sp. zg-B185]